MDQTQGMSGRMRSGADISTVSLMEQIATAFPDSLETPLPKLRVPNLSDAEEMFAYYTQDADVARYMVWQPHASLQVTPRLYQRLSLSMGGWLIACVHHHAKREWSTHWHA